MKLSQLAFLFSIGSAIASPTLSLRAILNPIWDGFPSGSVTCPNEGPSKGASFTGSYMKDDIEQSYPGPKAGYPAKFGTRAPGSAQFNFENGCLDRANAGEKIWELPMIPNGVTWAKASNRPGPYRVYYIIKDNAPGEVTVTYCGAYAHIDLTNPQAFEVCS